MSDDETPEQFYGLKNIKLAEDDLENLMFMGSVNELDEFLKSADNCIETVKQSDNIRLIILETLLFLDYFGVRQLLMSALDLGQLNHEDYDLRYRLLPRSFRECLNLLDKIKKVNQDLLPNPEHHRIRLPMKFLFFLKREHKDFLDNFISIEEDYYKKYHPELARQDPLSNVSSSILSQRSQDKDTFRRLSDSWLESVARIDDDWISKAKKLNDARNLAAHSYDNKKITACIGYAGEKADDQVKSYCLQLIEELMGVIIK